MQAAAISGIALARRLAGLRGERDADNIKAAEIGLESRFTPIGGGSGRDGSSGGTSKEGGRRQGDGPESGAPPHHGSTTREIGQFPGS